MSWRRQDSNPGSLDLKARKSIELGARRCNLQAWLCHLSVVCLWPSRQVPRPHLAYLYSRSNNKPHIPHHLLEWQIKQCYVHVSKMLWVYANNRCDYLLKVALPTAFHTMSAPVSPPDTTALPSSHLYPCAPGLGVHFLPLLVVPWAQVPSLAHSRSITVR